MQPGELFIVSGPSGAGKTTLIQSLMIVGESFAWFDVAFSVSHTTRAPRPGEIEGTDYCFIDHATFQEMITAGAFLEWAKVHDHYYGTSRQEVFPRLERGIDVLLDIDVQGAEQVLLRHPQAHSIFVMPPSYDDLERRLYRRGQDDAQAIARRLGNAKAEIQRYDRYHYVIINDDARRASEVLAAIILDKRHRRERMQPRVQEILRGFQDRSTTPPI
ncbi:MAG TPA: guanylate kinase [Thermoanaerobaculia bacterium]|jgi:guanylate kinase|nr:guanylate kinase [Thermoanaerobaculia bacterium]